MFCSVLTLLALRAQEISGWLARIREQLHDARQSGEIASDVDVDLEALAVWAYSAGVGQLGLLHPEWLPAKRQRQLIVAYLEKLKSD